VTRQRVPERVSTVPQLQASRSRLMLPDPARREMVEVVAGVAAEDSEGGEVLGHQGEEVATEEVEEATEVVDTGVTEVEEATEEADTGVNEVVVDSGVEGDVGDPHKAADQSMVAEGAVMEEWEEDLTGGEGATWAVSKQATDLSKPLIIHLPPHF